MFKVDNEPLRQYAQWHHFTLTITVPSATQVLIRVLLSCDFFLLSL